MFSGVNRGIEKERLTHKVIKELEEASYKTIFLQMAMKAAIQEYKHIRNIIKETTLSIRKISSEPMFAQVQPYLQSIDGIGLISAMAIQTEIQDMNRFRILDSLCDYAGFVPDISSSSDRTVIKGITHRRNEFLQETIIECSWTLIRKDPAMLMKYNEYKNRMGSNKAIIRIGKHLLSRIRYVWKNQQKYERGVVQ
jgi:transposase